MLHRGESFLDDWPKSFFPIQSGHKIPNTRVCSDFFCQKMHKHAPFWQTCVNSNENEQFRMTSFNSLGNERNHTHTQQALHRRCYLVHRIAYGTTTILSLQSSVMSSIFFRPRVFSADRETSSAIHLEAFRSSFFCFHAEGDGWCCGGSSRH